jgi:hypothetical protein
MASDGTVVAVLSPDNSSFRLVELQEERRSEERREWRVKKTEESQSRRKMWMFTSPSKPCNARSLDPRKAEAAVGEIVETSIQTVLGRQYTSQGS